MRDLHATSLEVIRELKQLDCALITVESCTGGLIASALTDISGASENYWGGLVTYDDTAKHTLAGVPWELLETHGAVSAEVARAMVLGGLKVLSEALPPQATKFRRRACVSVTGIAGPGGGTPANPVGSCWIGIGVDQAPPESRLIDALRFQAELPMTREEIKVAFAAEALRRLLMLVTSG